MTSRAVLILSIGPVVERLRLREILEREPFQSTGQAGGAMGEGDRFWFESLWVGLIGALMCERPDKVKSTRRWTKPSTVGLR